MTSRPNEMNLPDTGRCDGACPIRALLTLDLARAPESIWARAWKLQARHARVALMMMRGLTDRQIAKRLQLSHNTVRTYCQQVLDAAGASNRVCLMVGALRVGLGDEHVDAAR